MPARLKRHATLSARKRALLGSSAIFPLAFGLFGAPSAHAQAVNLGQAPGNLILANGRTATQIGVTGRTTTITTSTLSGGNAYNSFAQFREGRGNTVNLIVPGSAKNLVNVVTDGPVDIQGTLNSYKNGVIGGNVIFADSYGFVVGAAGVVNVGSLSIVTPTQKTIDQLISPSGVVNNALASQLIRGNVPISSDGSVLISGQVIAQHGVRINAHDVLVAGSLPEAERVARQRAQFESTVNAAGMTEGGAIVVRHGGIEIVATNNAGVDGALSAGGSKRRGGSVSIAAANTVAIGAAAKISVGAGHAGSGKATPAASQIVIAAGNDLMIAGALSAPGAAGMSGGSIKVTAGADADIAATSVLSVIGIGANSSGGTISVKPTANLTVADGATFDAHAGATGDGGFVELSAGEVATIGAIALDLAAPNGNAGTLLLDPYNLVVGDPNNPGAGSVLTNNSNFSYSGSLYTSGANVVLTADNSITIDGVIDTRAYSGAHVTGLLSAASILSSGDSGSITLSAPNITIASGAALYADADNSRNAGAVTLTATTSDSESLLASSATTNIDIAGTITGGAISATSSATASTVYNAFTGALLSASIGSLLGVSGGYLHSSANANVTVEGTANIHGSGAVALSSAGSETASDPAIDEILDSSSGALTAAAIVGQVNGTVETEIKSGATIYAGGALSATSSNSATFAINAKTYSLSGTTVAVTVAYSTGDVTTTSAIDTGAKINNAASVLVAAQNTNSFSTQSTAYAGGAAEAGIAVAVSDPSTSATAEMGASIASGAVSGGLTVYSGSDTTSNVVQASTTVGNSALVAGAAGLAQSAVGTVVTGVNNLFGSGGAVGQTSLGSTPFGKSVGAATSSDAIPKGGIVLALNMASQNSTASIVQIGGTAAPAITVAGDVAVVSLLTDAGLRSDASSTINGGTDGSQANPQTSSAVSMSANVDILTHSSNAFIGAGVDLTASHIGVDAETLTPITNTWTDFDTFSDVTSHLNGNLGIVSDILTSYANATAQSSTVGISGAIDYFQVTNDTTAWVGSGASLTQNTVGTATAPASWTSSIIPPGATTAKPIDWAAGVVVEASTITESIDVGGNFSWLTVFGTKNTSIQGTAVGGSANVDTFSSNTIAGVGEGAVIEAHGGLNVAANTQDLVYGVAPTSGSGSGLGLNGIVSVVSFDNTTSASISNLAEITAPSVAVNAEQDVSSFSIAGAVGSDHGGGVGIAVAIANVSMNTSAFIGDNSQSLSASGASADDAGESASEGYVDSNALAVSALSVGRLTTISVAAVYNNNAPDPTAPEPVKVTAPSDASFLSKAFYYIPAQQAARLQQQVDTYYQNLTSSNQNLVNGTSSVAGAGSTSVDLTNVGTSASIAGAFIAPAATNGTGNSVSVQALNNSITDTASGAAAIAKAAPGSSYAVGIAGAVAVGISQNMTNASIGELNGVSSNVTADAVTVQALAGGETTAIGLGISVTSGSANDSTNISASVSYESLNDGVDASIDGATIKGTTVSSTGTVQINADQETNVGIGGGSLYVSTGSGNGNAIGVALTYAEIGDPSGGLAVSASLSNSSVTDDGSISVVALDQSRILSGAATAGLGNNTTTGVAASVVVNSISPTVFADITGVPAASGDAAVTGGITVSGDVIVEASGGSSASLDNLISAAALTANGGLAGGGVPVDDSGLDFTGAALDPKSSTGASILAVAGFVQTGKSNVGASLVINNIDVSHDAVIDDVTLTSTSGVVAVSASDDTEILGIAVGVGVASGSVAGVGSVAYNSIADGVVAQIGHGVTTTDASGAYAATVRAAAVSVTATDGSTIRGAAGAIALNRSGGSAVGISAAVDQISNYVSANIAGAKVTANEPWTDGSPLIVLQSPLQAGSVVVSGASSADIDTIAIGVAISLGTASVKTPEANLASLVSGLKPSSPSSFAGQGSLAPGELGPIVALGTSAPKPPSAPTAPTNGVSGSGSFAISTEATDVTSAITDGALMQGSTVSANNSALVLASNSDAIAAYSGALSVTKGDGAGVGASIVLNEITDGTNAYIQSSTVDAQAQTSGKPVLIDNGVLSNAPDPSSVVTPASNPSLADGTVSFKGLAVVATADQTADTVAIVASVSTGGAAVSANSVTNTMDGSTSAYADSSSLDTHLASGAVSPVDISASSASFANLLDLGIAYGNSGGAGTIVLAINLMSGSTTASMTSTSLGSSTTAAGALTIAANSWEGTSGEAVGAAGSDGVGIAGSALVNTFSTDTEATLDHGVDYANSASVVAAGVDGYFGAVGTGAAGGDAGVGATVLVGLADMTTKATVGDSSASTGATTLNLTGQALVSATSQTDATSYVVGVSIGGGAGAAQVSALVATNTTQATIQNSGVTVTGSGDVDVKSQETVAIDPTAGGLAIGGTAGVGASVNLVMFMSDDSALIAGSTISTPGAVKVTALSTRDIDPITVTAAISADFSLAATVGVVEVGSGASSDALSVLNQGGTLDSSDQATGANLTTAVGGGVDGISAEILNGSVAAASVTIKATGEMAVENIVGALSIGFDGGGIGAAVGFTQVDQQVTAEADGGVIYTPTLTIQAQAEDDGSGHAARTIAAAGAGGLYVGLGAAVAESDVNNTVKAELGSTVNDNSTSAAAAATLISIAAGDGSTVRADAYGFAGGAAAVGGSVALASRDSAVTADVLGDAQLTSMTVQDQASDGGETWAYALAGAGGIGAGAAAVATATDDAAVTAELVTGATVLAADTQVSATDTPDAKGMGFGVAVGGAAAGASVVLVTADPTVTAAVDDGVVFQVSTVGATTAVYSGLAYQIRPAGVTTYSGSLEVTAQALVGGAPATSFPGSALPASTDGFSDGGTTAAGWALAGAGGSFIGVQATYVKAEDDASVVARVGSIPTDGSVPTGLVLPMGDVAITATNNSDQYSQSTGVSVGYIAVGVVLAYANADTNTQALLGENVETPFDVATVNGVLGAAFLARGGALTLNATGTDTDVANSQSGAGGVFAGSGGEAHTSDTSNVSALIGADAVIDAGAVTISATHTDDYAAELDALNASAVGASGSVMDNEANSTVAVTLGSGVTIMSSDTFDPTSDSIAANAVAMTASNNFSDDFAGSPHNTLQAAGGGAVNGFGADSTTNLTGASTVTFTGQDNVSAGSGGVVILALSNVSNNNDTVTLNTGGALEGSGVSDSVSANLTNSVAIGDASDAAAASQIDSQGGVILATYANGSVTTSSAASTYGLAGVADANSSASITANQAVNVYDTTIFSVGEVDITAGLNPVSTNFGQTSLTVNSNAESYVRALIAIPVANADANIASNASVGIDKDTIVNSGASVVLGAYHGAPNVSASGTAHGYELGLIPVTSYSEDPTSSTSGVVTLDGAVTAGYYHDQVITIDCAAGCNSASAIPTVTLVSGAPVTIFDDSSPLGSGNSYTLNIATGQTTYTPTSDEFNVNYFVGQTFDPTVGGILQQGVNTAGTTQQAIILGNLYAAGGVVQVNADTIKGAGSATAYGNPTITVTNNSAAAVILYGNANIPDTPSGEFIFTGAAGQSAAQASGWALKTPSSTATSGFSLAMNYAGTSQNSAFGPVFINYGSITTLGGAATLYSANGFFGQLGGITAASVSETATNGGLVVSSNEFNLGSPIAEWQNYENYPGLVFGGAPGGAYSETNGGSYGTNILLEGAASTFVDYIANMFITANNPQRFDPNGSWGALAAILNQPAAFLTSEPLLNIQIYGSASRDTDGTTSFGLFGDNAVTNLKVGSGRDAVSTAYLFFNNYNAANDPPYGDSSGYQFTPFSSTYYPYIPTEAVRAGDSPATSNAASGFLLQSNAYADATPPVTSGTGTFGGPIAIKANIIDINAPITSGNTNTLSLDYGSSLNAALTNDRTNYAAKGAQFYALPTQTTDHITATYDAKNNVIDIGNITASTGGGYVLLDGQIINTTPVQTGGNAAAINGSITVNGGLGQVAISNESSAGLQLADVQNGATVGGHPVQSIIKIIDTLKDNNGLGNVDTTTYLFTPGQGVATYTTGYGADANLNSTPNSFSTSSTGLNYQPVANARYEWTQTAYLRPTQNSDGTDTWYFTDANGNTIQSNNPFFTQTFVTAAPIQNYTAATISQEPIFQETMSAAYGENGTYTYSHAGCNNTNLCYYGYLNIPGSGGGDGNDGTYTFQDFYALSLTLTNSVKADNQIGINFYGNATGLLNVTSGNTVTLAGNISNASGLTSIQVSNGDILETANATLTTQNLQLAASGAIGSAAQPFTATMTMNAAGTPTGVVQASASAAGGVNLAFNSAAAIGNVTASTTTTSYTNTNVANNFGTVSNTTTYGGASTTAYGDVTITALGNLTAAPSTANPIAVTSLSPPTSTQVTSAGGGIFETTITTVSTGAASTYGNAPTTANVTGRNITLSSLTGSIGSGFGASATPLALSANTTTSATGQVLDGVVNALASGNIALTGVTGDFRIGLIDSTSGDITINVPNGFILNANGLTSSQTLSADQLSAVEDRLHLTEADGGAGGNTLVPFQNAVDADYAAYQTLVAHATIAGGVMTLTSAGLQYYAPTATATLLAPYNALLASGAIVNGTFTLSNSGVQTYASAALGTTQLATFNNLLTNGTVTSTGFNLSATGLRAYAAAAAAADKVATATNAQIQTYAASLYNGLAQQVQNYAATQEATAKTTFFTGAAATNASIYEGLLTNGTVGAGGAFTLSAAGLQAYASAAATADKVATATNAQIQAYAVGLYASVAPVATAQQIQTYASTQYSGYVSTFEKAFATSADPTGANWQTTLGAISTYAAYNTQVANQTTYTTLQSYGSVVGGHYILNASGLAYYTNPTAVSSALGTKEAGVYNTLLANGTFANGALTQLSAAGLAIYAAPAASYYGVATATNAQILSYAAGLYAPLASQVQAYVQSNAAALYTAVSSSVNFTSSSQYTNDVATFTQAFGANWQTSLATLYNGNAAGVVTINYTVDPTSALYTSLTQNAVWTAGELTQAVDQSALAPAQAIVGNAPASLVGRNIYVSAADGVGQTATAVKIQGADLASLEAGTLTDQNEIAALANATSPGSVIVATDNTGHVTSLTLAEIQPLFVSATGAVSASSSSGQILLQATGSTGLPGSDTLQVGAISAPSAAGNVNLAAPVGIVEAAGAAALSIVAGGELTLAAGTGDIGSASSPVTFQTPLLNDASAGSVYLQSIGDVAVGRIFANADTGVVSLTATAGSGQSGNIVETLPGLAITASAINLVAAGDIGSSATPFAIGDPSADVGANPFTISGSSGGATYLTTEAINGHVQPVIIDGFAAGDGLNIHLPKSDVNNGGATLSVALTFSGATTSSAGGVTAEGASITMASGASIDALGEIQLTADSGDVELGQLVSGISAAKSTPAIVVTANSGAISGNGDGQVNLVAPNAFAAVSLSAQSGVGASSLALSVDTTLLSATTAQGGLYFNTVTTLPTTPAFLTLSQTPGLEATNLSAVKGDIVIAGAAALMLDDLVAGTGPAATLRNVTAQSSRSITVEAIDASGAVSLNANSNIASNGSPSVTAAALSLTSGADIGSSATPFSFDVSGLLSGSASGSAWLASADAVNVSTFSGAKGVFLTSGGALRVETVATDIGGVPGSIAGAVTSSSGVVTLEGASVGMDSGASVEAAKLISVTADTGGVTLGQLVSSDGGPVATPAITVTASSGTIVANGDGQTNLVAPDKHAEVTLTATSIGAANAPLAINAPLLSATASSGGIYLATVTALPSAPALHALSSNNALEATLLSAVEGSVDIEGAAALTLDSVNAGTASDATQGDITAKSTSTIAANTLTAYGSATVVAGGGNSGVSVTTEHGGVTLSAGELSAPSSINLDWTTVQAGTSLTATSGGALTLGATNSNGTQTIEGAGAVGFGNLTAKAGSAGDIFVTSDAGAIAGGSVAADRSAKLISHTSNSGSSVVATTGDADVEAGTVLSWSSVSAPKGNATVVAGTGDLTIESVTTGGAARLEASTGNIRPVDANATLISSSLTLTAGGDIGVAPVAPSTIATPFSFTLGAGGFLSGSAGGSAWLTSAGAVDVTTFSVGDALSLSVGGALRVETVQSTATVDGAISSANGPVTLRAAAFGMDSGASVSAGGAILISAAGDVTLGEVTSASADTAQNVIDIEAGAASLGAVVTSGKGNILGNGDSAAGIADAKTGVWGSLNAGDAIGPLSVGIANLNATADAGNLSLRQTAALHAANLSAVRGSVDIEGASALTLDDVAAGATFTAKSTAATVTIGAATSGGTQTIEAYLGLGYTTLKTNGMTGDVGDIKLTSDTMSITGNALSDTLDVNGSFILYAATTINATSLTAETGTGFVKSGGTIWLGSATSQGTQTIEAQDAIGFTTLTSKAGDVDVTSDAASITGGSVAANGSASLTSVTSNTGATVTATNGGVTLAAGGLASPSTLASIDWTNVNAGTFVTATSGGGLTLGTVTSGKTGSGGIETLHGSGTVGLTTLDATGGTIGVTSDASTVTIGSAKSDGTQTIEAYLGLGYTTLKTKGMTGDVGDIKLTSDTASITGNATGDTLDANGSFILNAATAINATALTAETGTGFVRSGGTIGLGSATSQGTETIEATDAIGFTTLTSKAGDVDVTSDTASIAGGSLTANGSASLTSVTSNAGATVTATHGGVTLAAGSLASPSTLASIDWSTVNAGTFVTATSGGGLTLGSVTSGKTGSGGVETLHGSGALALTTLNATGGTIGATSDASSVTIGSATSDGTETIEAYLGLGYTTLKTNGMTGDVGDIKLTSDTTSITGNAPSDTLDAHGSFSLNAPTAINATALTAETGTGFVKSGGTIGLGSATSQGTETIEANNDLSFTTLKTTGVAGNAGSIDLTSTLGAVKGQGGSSLIASNADVTISGVSVLLDTVTTKGKASIDAVTTLAGTSLTTGGDASLTAGVSTNLTPTNPVSLSWTNVNAGTTFEAQAYGGTIATLGSATSGGTQTIGATGDIGFTTLLAKAGDIDATSTAGSIAGTTATAKDSADLAAYGDNTGTTLTTLTGSATLSATTGRIDWTNVNAATTFAATATAGKIELGAATSGGTQTIEAYLGLGYTTLKTTGIAGGDVGDIRLTSDTMSITGNALSDTLDANGSFILNAPTAINATALTAETGTGFVKSGGTIGLGSATSQGTETIEANNDLSFTTLKTTGVAGNAGSIDLTSTLGAVKGQGGSSLIASNADVTISGVSVLLDTVTTKGKASIDAVTTLAGTSLTTGGDASLTAGVSTNLTPTNPVSLSWTNVNAGTTFEAQAYGGTIATLGSATSGGTQTIGATGDIGFTTLLAKAGDIDATSTAGSIAGTTATAKDSADLAAYGDNTGTTLTTLTGSATLSATTGRIDWTNVNAATTFAATATAGKIELGAATSGGTQKLTANNDLSFAMLKTTGTATDPGDIILKSFTGAMRGGSIDAHGSVAANAVGIDFDQINANGDLTLNSSADIVGNGFAAVGAVAINAAGVVKFGSASGATISLSTKGDMTINNLEVATALDIASNNLNIGLLSQTPGAPGPLELTITGFGGTVGNSANLTIDAPSGLYVPVLREATAVIRTDALQISMIDPTITKSMLLTTPDQVLWFNDVSSQPVLGNNVQFYQPDDEFYLQVNNRFVKTDSYIVQYDASAQVQQEFNGALINGPSFVRDFDRMEWGGDNEKLFVEGGADNQNNWQFPVEAFDLHLQRFFGGGIALAQPGQPAVGVGDSGVPTELVGDGLGFTIIVKKKHAILPGALTHRGVHAHGKFREAMR